MLDLSELTDKERALAEEAGKYKQKQKKPEETTAMKGRNFIAKR